MEFHGFESSCGGGVGCVRVLVSLVITHDTTTTNSTKNHYEGGVIRRKML